LAARFSDHYRSGQMFVLDAIASREDRRRSGSGRTQGRQHGVMAGKDRPELVDAARVALADADARSERAELPRRAHERRDVVPPVARLADQGSPSAAGRAEDQDAHGTRLAS